MKAGLATAIATVGAGEAPASAAEQLALLPAAAGETLAEPVGLTERRIGRPAGARNRRTKEMVDWLLNARGLKPPLEFLLELLDKSTAELVDLGVKAEEALKLKVHAATAALPYVHQKQPMAVEAVGKTAGLLVLPGEGGTAEEQAEEEANKLAEAEPLYREALAIEIKLLGDAHSKVVLTRTDDRQLKPSKQDDLQRRAQIADDADADVFDHRQQVIDDLEPLRLGREIAAAQVNQRLEAALAVVAQELQQLHNRVAAGQHGHLALRDANGRDRLALNAFQMKLQLGCHGGAGRKTHRSMLPSRRIFFCSCSRP